jgi:hypothetical protein
VVGLGVPVGGFFSAHFGDTFTDLVNTVAAAKGLGGAQEKFDLRTGHLVEIDRLARGPEATLDAACLQDVVNGASDSASPESLDLDMALLAFEVGGLEVD